MTPNEPDTVDAALEEERKRRIREKVDARRAARAAATPKSPGADRPAATTVQPDSPEMGMGAEIGHGLARGGAQIMGSVGTGLKVAGIVTGDARAKVMGEVIAKSWSDIAAKFPKSKKAEGSLWDDDGFHKEMLVSPRWLAAGVAETVPSLAASLIPAMGAQKALLVGGKAMEWSAPLVLKLARVGAAVTGGVAGGTMEGASTFEYVKAKGGSDEDAARAYALMSLASAGLNAISLGKMMDKGPLVARAAKAGGWEALTEWLESPAEAVIVGDDVLQAMKQGLDVVPASFITGAAGGAAAGRRGAETDAAPKGTVQGGPDLTQKPENAPVQQPEVRRGPASPEPITSEQAGRMTPEALQAAADAQKQYEKDALKAALGADAKEFARLDRKQHRSSGLTDEERTRFAEFEKRIMADPELARLVYGIDETGLNAEELGSIARNAADYGPGSPLLTEAEDSWLAQNAGEIVAKFDAGDAGMVVRLRGLVGEMGRRGMTPEEISTAIRGNLESRVEPADAAVLLEAFQREVSKPAHEPGKAAGAPEGSAPLGSEGEPAAPGAETTGSDQSPAEHELTVNLKYYDISRRAKEVAADINRRNAERMADDRATKHLDEDMEEGRRFLPTIESVLEWDPDQPHPRGATRAAAEWAATLYEQEAELRAAFRRGEKVDADKWEDITTTAEVIGAKVEYAESDPARRLRLQQVPVGPRGGGTSTTNLKEFLARMREVRDSDPSMSAEDRMALADALSTQAQRKEYYKQYTNWLLAGFNMAHEAWMSGLVSNPQTIAGANPLSNAGMILWSIRDRAVAAHINKDAEVHRGEAMAMVRGLVEAQREALTGMVAAFKSGVDPNRRGKTDSPVNYISKEYYREAFGKDPTGLLANLDTIGHMVRAPLRALMATDVYFKIINYRVELKAQAIRQANREAAFAAQRGKPWSDERLANRVRKIESRPSERVREAAQEFALYQTFQNDMGQAGKQLQRLVETTRVGKVVVPFIRTPTNITARAIQSTGVIQFLSPEMWRDLTGPPGARRDMARARVATASFTSAAVAAAVAAGHITGGGPDDPDLKRQKRDTRWQPYSVRIGDTWYAYSRLDPVGMTIGMIADWVEIAGERPGVHLDSDAAALVMAVAKNITSKSYTVGIANFLEAVNRPSRGAEEYGKGLARSAVPAWMRNLSDRIDPELKETRTWLDEIRAGIPGWSKGLPARRNIFGEKVLLSGGLGPDIVSPIYRSDDKHDAVTDELYRVSEAMGRSLSMPPKVIEGSRPGSMFDTEGPSPRDGIELTPKEYDLFVQYAAEGLHDSLARLIKSSAYQQQGDPKRDLLIREIVYARREAGRAKLIRTAPGLYRAVTEKRKERARAMSSRASQGKVSIGQ